MSAASAAYDPELCARLAGEARQLLSRFVWQPIPDNQSRRALAAMADQLEAAQAEVEHWREARRAALEGGDQLRESITRLDFTIAAERAQMAPIRAAVEAFIETVNAAIRAARPSRGGQHVPYHGDFCAAGPSVLGRLQWWGRNLKDALPKEGM